MQYMDDLEEQIDKLVRNNLGIDVIKNFSRGILSAEIIIPKDKFAKGITKSDIKFEIIIDSYSPTLYPVPKLYCLTPYCFPNLADGRDLFRELRNLGSYRKGDLLLNNLLQELMDFVKINFQRGGLMFCGNYYLEDRYETRFFDNNKCKVIQNVKQNLVIKGKNTEYNRILILSDVHFLLFKKDKANKNSLILLFWASFNNIEKIQKFSDNKTVILRWITQDKNTTQENKKEKYKFRKKEKKEKEINRDKVNKEFDSDTKFITDHISENNKDYLVNCKDENIVLK